MYFLTHFQLLKKLRVEFSQPRKNVMHELPNIDNVEMAELVLQEEGQSIYPENSVNAFITLVLDSAREENFAMAKFLMTEGCNLSHFAFVSINNGMLCQVKFNQKESSLETTNSRQTLRRFSRPKSK